MDTEQRILNVFRERRNGYVSGSELGRILGRSRAAVWKHIEKLRQSGYQIVAFPHLGYRLESVPDKLLPDELEWKLDTKIIGEKIYTYESTDSTNDVAEHMALGGEAEGTVVFAEKQIRGRGRQGRKWTAVKGTSLLFSFIIRPGISVNEAPRFTLITAVAASRAIRKTTGLRCLIKWPNDLIVNGGKIGGILTGLNAEVNLVRFLVIGVGINVNNGRESLPKGAVSIKTELNGRFSRIELARELMRRIDEYYLLYKEAGFAPIIREWKNLSATLGKHVIVKMQAGAVEGHALNLDENGELIVRDENGFRRRIISGDVISVR